MKQLLTLILIAMLINRAEAATVEPDASVAVMDFGVD